MPLLSSLLCPNCRTAIEPTGCADRAPVASRFDDCLRRCEPCGIAASNTATPEAVTFIHRDPLGNIPIESRKGAREVLSKALNIRNRESKWTRFGFSTSEDAVTWVVFTYLLRSGQLYTAMQHSGLISEDPCANAPTLLLWGAPIDDVARGGAIRKRLTDQCAVLGENPNSLSEPDVIIDLQDEGLIFIEVKHRSGNDFKSLDYRGWEKYASADPVWRYNDVMASGCYELARNWCLLKSLAAGRAATLVSLGPAKLFVGAEGERLNRFVSALGDDARSHFRKVSWTDFLDRPEADRPAWFARFCCNRDLMT